MLYLFHRNLRDSQTSRGREWEAVSHLAHPHRGVNVLLETLGKQLYHGHFAHP